MKNNQDIINYIIKNLKTIIFVIIIIVLVFLNIKMFRKLKGESPKENTKVVAKQENTVSAEEKQKRNEEERINQLYSMRPEERMRRYLGEYVGFLREKDYEKAYSKLNENFKNNYFKSVNDYKAYIEKYYPKDIVIEYGNRTQQGELSIIEITFSDRENKSFNSFTQRYVVKENDAMDYTISFQVE